MNRREAKARIFRSLAAMLDNDTENAWLHEDLDDADAARMCEAFDEVIAEFKRRGGGTSVSHQKSQAHKSIMAARGR